MKQSLSFLLVVAASLLVVLEVAVSTEDGILLTDISRLWKGVVAFFFFFFFFFFSLSSCPFCLPSPLACGRWCPQDLLLCEGRYFCHMFLSTSSFSPPTVPGTTFPSARHCQIPPPHRHLVAFCTASWRGCSTATTIPHTMDTTVQVQFWEVLRPLFAASLVSASLPHNVPTPTLLLRLMRS